MTLVKNHPRTIFLQSSMQRTLITPRPPDAPPSLRVKPKIPSIIIPGTTPHLHHTSFIQHDKVIPVVQVSQPIKSTPHSPFVPLSPASSTSTPSRKPDMPSAAPSDLQAVAELFATLKRTLSTLHSTFDRLGDQTEKLAYHAPAIQMDQQIADARSNLESQIAMHEQSMEDVQSLLKNAVADSVVHRLKAAMYISIQKTVAQEIESRVRKELEKQLPGRLQLQLQDHVKETLEIRTTLCNSEARRHNASLRSPAMDTEPLRPLLRPLPSALQSPAYILKQPFTTNNSTVTSPMTAFPAAPVPTPLVVGMPAIMFPPGSKQVFELVPPTPSPLFPRDMRSLFAMGPEAAKRLLNDYGLESTSAAPSPMRIDCPSIRIHTGLNTPDTSPVLESCTTREEDINKFMAHIGVPYLMVPVPKPKTGPQLHLVVPRSGSSVE